MSASEPIDALLQRVKAVIVRSHALFGFVFEFTVDGLGIMRGCPLFGSVRDESVLRDYFKPLGEQVLGASALRQNKSLPAAVREPFGTEPQEGHLYVAIQTQGMGVRAGVAVVYQAANDIRAASQLLELEAALDDSKAKKAVGGDGQLWFARLLESCEQQKKDAVLVAGYPPFLRFEGRLRALDATPLTAGDLAGVPDNTVPPIAEFTELPGLRAFDLRFGDLGRYRVAVLGLAEPLALVVTRLSETSVELDGCIHGWVPNTGGAWVEPLKQNLAGTRANALIVGGSPPFVWAADGLSPASHAPVLSDSEVAAFVSRLTGPSNRIRCLHGYEEFGLSLNGEHFRVAMFGQPPTIVLVLLRE